MKNFYILDKTQSELEDLRSYILRNGSKFDAETRIYLKKTIEKLLNYLDKV